MRAKEFMNEEVGQLAPDVAKAIPGVFVFPNLTNQDPYKQYRFGLEIAAANSDHNTDTSSKWGENLVVATYSSGDKEILDKATKNAKQQRTEITASKSEETTDVGTTSPVAARKKNKYGV